PQEAGNTSTLRCNACCPEVKEEASFPAERGTKPGDMEGDRRCSAAPRHASGQVLLQRVRHAACSKRSAAAQQGLRRRAPPCIRDTPPPSPPRCAPLTRATCAAYCPPPPVTDGTSGEDPGFPRVFTCYGLAPLQPIRDQQPCCRR